jgi:YbbR domain-containing protein
MAEKRKKFRKINFRVFSTILVITALTSIMLKLNKDFTFRVKVPVSFNNLPQDKLLKTYNTSVINVSGVATGYEYLKYKFYDQHFNIDLAALTKKDSNLFYHDFNPDNDRLTGSLVNSVLKSFKPDTLFVILDTNFEKKVPVRSQIELNYAPGYGSLKGLEINPDSVLVRGPKSSIDTLQAVYTLKERFKAVKSNLKDSIQLTSLKRIKQLTIEPKTVKYNVDVDKFTEGTLTVPLQLINVPPQVTAKIFPKRVKLIFNVNFKNYDRLKPSDFKVVCDFNKIDSTSTTLTPEIVQSPTYVRDLRLAEKTVQYLFVK